MRFYELTQNLDEAVKVGDCFDIELDDIVIESVVVEVFEDGIIIAADDTALSYIVTEDLDEGLKSKLAALGLAASMAMNPLAAKADANVGMDKPAVTQSQFSKDYLEKVVRGEHPRPMISKEKAQDLLDKLASGDTEISKPSSEKPADSGPGFSKDYLEKVVKGEHPRPMLSKDYAQQLLNKYYREGVDEAKYRGKEVPLGKKLPGDVKKSKVYVRKPNGKIVKVNFGDKKMRIKKSNPKRRKSFRARHNCKNPGPRWKARYWSCRSW